MACSGPTIERCARLRIPYGLPNDPVMTSRWSNAQMALGYALVHRPTAAERDRGQKLLAELSEAFPRRGRHLGDLPLVERLLGT